MPPTPGQPIKEPMFILVAMGLLDSSGKDMPLSSFYQDGKLVSITSGAQPVYTTVLRVTKVILHFVRALKTFISYTSYKLNHFCVLNLG